MLRWQLEYSQHHLADPVHVHTPSEFCAPGQQDTHYGERSELLAVTQTSYLLKGSVFTGIVNEHDGGSRTKSIVVDNKLTTATIRQANWDRGKVIFPRTQARQGLITHVGVQEVKAGLFQQHHSATAIWCPRRFEFIQVHVQEIHMELLFLTRPETKQSKGENKGYTEWLENRCIAVEFLTAASLVSVSIYRNVRVSVCNERHSLFADRTKVIPLAAVHMTDYPYKKDWCKADTGGWAETFFR